MVEEKNLVLVVCTMCSFLRGGFCVGDRDQNITVSDGNYKCLLREIWIDRTISSMMRSCSFVQTSSTCMIAFMEEIREVGASSYKRSSVLTSKTVANATRTGRLNLVLPVSIWLMCVVEMFAFSARVSCENPNAFLNLRIRCPIA